MRRKRGQSTVEYLAMITIIIGVFIGVGTYFKRGIQGRWKEAVDGLGDQYDPRVTNTDVVDRMYGASTTRITTFPVNGGVWTLRDDASNMTQEKYGASRVAAY
jgi:hypothetical protein